MKAFRCHSIFVPSIFVYLIGSVIDNFCCCCCCRVFFFHFFLLFHHHIINSMEKSCFHWSTLSFVRCTTYFYYFHHFCEANFFILYLAHADTSVFFRNDLTSFHYAQKKYTFIRMGSILSRQIDSYRKLPDLI